MKNEKVEIEMKKIWKSIELLESAMLHSTDGKVDVTVCEKSVLLQRDAAAEIEQMIEEEM